MHDDIAEVLISSEALHRRVVELGAQIAERYRDTAQPMVDGKPEGVTLITILSGSIVFLSDLIRHLPIRMNLGLITVSSYPGRATTTQGSRVEEVSLPDVRNRRVLIVDDILDTGGTLRAVQRLLREAGASDVRTVVLLRKRSKAPADVPVDFVGFDVEDRFVVGYGLDYDGHYRNLPFIGTLKPSVLGKATER